jgi:uncharacterized membrane protein
VIRQERGAIAAAIAAAEDGTTGRIAVRVIPDATVDALERAKLEFERIGLNHHRSANGTLILVAPKAQRFAVIGDRALHERVGDAFWNGVVEESRKYFERGEISDGVIAAVQRIGEALRMHFPQAAGERAP